MRSLLITLVALPCPPPLVPAVSTAGLEEGVEAYSASDHETALKQIKPLAEEGDPEAQYKLGRMYYTGEVVPIDDRKAIHWFKKAAEQAHARAQYNLGSMLDNGEGTPQDFKQSLLWHTKAADQGEASAQHNLGVMCYKGEGVPRNHVEAFKWFGLSARNGEQPARKALNELSKEMTSAQIEEAMRLLREWKPKAGDSQAE